MSETIFMFDAEDPEMQKAYRSARETFRYFWRELAWEQRRIVPGLDMAMVKVPFTDGPRTDGNSEHEHMWVGDVMFDGDSITGTLLNAPKWLTSVRKGQAVSVPFSSITDWMMTAGGRAYGGHTVNLMRARMDRSARAQHDQAWGLDFGDPSDIQIEIHRQPKAKKGLFAGLFGKASPQASASFSDHPMCVNMLPKVEAQLKADPSLASFIDDQGWTMLHHEALAGNLGIVTLLLRYGADPAARTPSGYTAAELAKKVGWSEVADSIP
ncbi:DUF2314 domain-containing protein [Prosthecobacter sp.]|uniref:DUF2314 domain-containing protein n=1 Tax=Prosthecobacter sp. TaxID=1965333 RepID=UPI003784E2DD